MKPKQYYSLLAFCAIFIILLTHCVPTPAPGTETLPSDLSALLSELQGKVELKNPDQADFMAARAGDRLQVEGQLRTGADGRARLDLSTGTIVRVASNTLFVLQSNQSQETGLLTRIKLEAGKLWVILKGGRLDIETPSGLASVRGSLMSVWVDPQTQDVWVNCLEGWCKAENPSAALDLIAGQGATLYSWDPQGTVPPPPPALRYLSPEDIEQFLANNPEAQEVVGAIVATASALPTFTATKTITTSPTPTLTLTSTPTFTPTLTTASCVTLLSPADGADFPGPAKVEFAWTPHPNASQYLVTFKSPSGWVASFLTPLPSIVRYIEAFYEGGRYQWWVTAKNEALEPLCTSSAFTFTKPETFPPTATYTPTGGGGTGGGGGGGEVLFWNQQGPSGPQTSCAYLIFSVTTSLEGMVKVIYSTENPNPTGSDPHFVIGTGPGMVTGSSDAFASFGGGVPIYWRFAVYNNGVYTYDPPVFSFTCPCY